MQLSVLALGIATAQCSPTAQTRPERFWLAGRYDGNRIIVYFEGVKFKGTMPSSLHKLAPPIADRFFDPVQLPASYISQFQKGASVERFAIGDRYDLLLDHGKIATVTLSTLVGTRRTKKWATILYLRPAAIRAGVIREKDGITYGPDGEVVKRFGFHTFRHSLATCLMDERENPAVVQAIMRHSKMDMTLYYSHSRSSAKRAAQEKVVQRLVTEIRVPKRVPETVQ